MGEEANIIRCPRCGGRDVRRSQARGPIDYFMLLLQQEPFRCRRCERRFFHRPRRKSNAAAAAEPLESDRPAAP